MITVEQARDLRKTYSLTDFSKTGVDMADTIIAQAEAIERVRAAAWDEGEAAGWSRANRTWSDEPLLKRAENPYRAALDGAE